jgi:dipeptidyl aminopeptidase/acylaminoacyl peptidase
VERRPELPLAIDSNVSSNGHNRARQRNLRSRLVRSQPLSDLAASPAPAGRPIGADDLYRIAIVGDPQLSPDASTVAYVVTRLDKEADDYRAAIWLAPLNGGEPRPLTGAGARDTHPRWSPDGRSIAFVSNRPPHLPRADADEDEKDGDAKVGKKKPEPKARKPPTQVWIIPVDGGEARQLTNQEHGASAPCWSPDGRTIAFLAAVDAADDRDRPDRPKAVADERVIDLIRYRHDGRGFVAGRYAHLWMIPAGGGSPKQLTFGEHDDDQPAWSPDGRLLAFVSNRSDGHEHNTVSAIYAVPAVGGDVRPLAEIDAAFHSPAWSPDGARLAFLGHAGAAESGRITRVWTVPAAGGEPTCVTPEIDRAFTDEGMGDLFAASDVRPAWSADGSGIFALASERGAVHLQRIDAATGEASSITAGPARVAAFSLGASSVVFLRADAATPFEVWTCAPDGSGARPLSRHNEQFLAEVPLAPIEELLFRTSADDRDLQGWLLKPPGFDLAVKHPMIVQIHGGPHAMYGHAPFHEMHVMAARGYVVLFTNPRGSAGYGEAFATCTRGRWGKVDMPDIVGAVDAAVALGFVDSGRIGVTGGSYGGYLTNWIVGHTDRFRAAVTQRCVSNLHSMYGTSDIGFDFGEMEFGGTPWADANLLLRHSPLSYVDKIETPLLILHSEDDLRCPIEQAEQLFVALKRLGKETSFVRFPKEDHNLSRTGTPSRRLARLHHLIGWFDNHL